MCFRINCKVGLSSTAIDRLSQRKKKNQQQRESNEKLNFVNNTQPSIWSNQRELSATAAQLYLVFGSSDEIIENVHDDGLTVATIARCAKQTSTVRASSKQTEPFDG